MKKTLAIFAILLMAFSSLAFAEGEEAAAPAPEAPSEPAPAETPPEPEAPSEPAPEVAPGPLDVPETGEQPVSPPVPGEPGSGGQPQPPQQPGICYWDGKQIPCDQMPSTRQPGVEDQPQQPQQGPGRGGCWVGEQQVPCPGEGQQYQGNQPIARAPSMPAGCREVRDANGMFTVDCAGQQRPQLQFECTSGPDRERIEKECAAKGGRTVVRNMIQSEGCGIIDCVFGGDSGNFMPGQQQTCPGPDELAQKEQACRSMGLTPKRMRSSCEFVQCEDPNKQGMQCHDNPDEWEKVSQACTGKVVKAFDENGCNIPQCVSSGEQCPNNVPQEAYFKCQDQGGKLVVNTDENGCIAFSKCVKRGEEGVQAEDELDEVPPAAKLLQVALKLESIKISFDQMAKQITAIADYYENEGDDANAERFRTAAGMFESAKKQIDGVKEELKMGAKGMSVEQVIDIKHKIRQISDVVMEDALYVILGGDAAGMERVTDETEYESGQEGANCGSDGNCFHKALRICMAGTAFSPDKNVNIKITGLEEGACRLEGRADTPEGDKALECKFTDYATDQLNTENFMNYCGGPFVEYVRNSLGGKLPETTQRQQQFTNEQAFQGQMMGCEKVDKGINKRGVCGNECCEERFGESYYSCPQDCMAPQQQQAGQNQRQPFVERAQQAFKQDGAGGCQDEISGESPKDVCGNECCEPMEGPDNCPQDCNAMQRQPLSDNGQFFNEQRGPAPAGREGEFGMNPEGQYYGEQAQGAVQMPREQWIEPQQQENPPQEYIEPKPAEEQPVSEEQPAAEETAAAETTGSGDVAAGSSGGGAIATGAFVAIDLLKEFLGR